MVTTCDKLVTTSLSRPVLLYARPVLTGPVWLFEQFVDLVPGAVLVASAACDPCASDTVKGSPRFTATASAPLAFATVGIKAFGETCRASYSE
jgi:hypothetical protein